MNESILIDKYCFALLEAATLAKKQQVVLDELESLKKLFRENPAMFKYLSAPILTDENLDNIFTNLFKKVKFSKYTEQLLTVMAKNKRLKFFLDICRGYKKLYKKQQGELEFTVSAAKKMSLVSLKEITESLEKITNHKIFLKQKIDKKLIDGFTLQFESVLIDNSVASKLKDLKYIALEELEGFKLSEVK